MKSELYIFTHEFHPKKGGIGTFCAEMALAASELNFNVTVFAPYDSIPLPGHDPYCLVPCSNRGTHRKECVRKTALKMLLLKRKLRDGIVYLSEPGPMLAYYRLNKYLGYRLDRVVLTFHGTEIKRWSESQRGISTLQRLVELASRISCVSNYVASLLYKVVPTAKDKVIVQLNCPKKLDKESVKMVSAISSKNRDKISLLTVGRLHPRKGLHYLLETLKELPPVTAAKLVYHIVGVGDDINYVKKLKKLGEGLGFPVKFHGDVPECELNHHYASSDIFILTSVPYENSIEGFGLVYLDAGLWGLPVIAHDIGGVSDAVQNGFNGMLVEPYDKKKLLEAVTTIVEDSALRIRLGENGHKKAQMLDWKKNVRVLFNFS